MRFERDDKLTTVDGLSRLQLASILTAQQFGAIGHV